MPQQSPPVQAPDPPYLPPPPPPDHVLALLRWSLAVLKASTGRDRAAIRRHYAAEDAGGGESLGTVVIAMGTDLAMFAAKAAAAALTGSPRCSPNRCTRWPTRATRCCCSPACAGPGGGRTPPTPSGTAPRAALRERIAEAIPRVAVVSLMPVVAVEHPPEPTPWDRDYWLRRFPDHEQA